MDYTTFMQIAISIITLATVLLNNGSTKRKDLYTSINKIENDVNAVKIEMAKMKKDIEIIKGG